MPNKRLHEMGANPEGPEVFSAMKYLVRYLPKPIADIYGVYGHDDNMLISWCTGFTYALTLIEECGMPIDIDEVLYSWDREDEPFDIGEAVKKWIEENGNG